MLIALWFIVGIAICITTIAYETKWRKVLTASSIVTALPMIPLGPIALVLIIWIWFLEKFVDNSTTLTKPLWKEKEKK